MLISEVVKRLEALKRMESDIHVVVVNQEGVVVEEMEFDIYTSGDMTRRVMVYPMETSVEVPEQEDMFNSRAQVEDIQSVEDMKEEEYEEQPVQEVHERTSRQRRSRST